jgi:hypothetical protein
MVPILSRLGIRVQPVQGLPESIAPLVEAARREHGAGLVDRLVAGAMEGDPLADRLVTSFRSLPSGTGWRMLDEALEHGPELVEGAPPELADLVAPARRPPAWVDHELVDAGALAFWRSGGVNIGLALVCGSLAYGYRNARLTRPLAATGRLERMAPRRLQETARWVAAATRPGALRPGGAGVGATLRLRMVHALVRRHLLDGEDWDLGAWGVPISASDTLLTAIGGFLVVPLRALADLGVRLAPAELEAMTHQWVWIASLMGTPDDLLPGSYAEARATMEAAAALDEGPNEDSPKLMRALLYNGTELPFEGMLPAIARRPVRAVKARLLGGFARRWMDAETAEMLGVPSSPLSHLVPLLRPLALAREVARAAHLLGSDERIARIELGLLARIDRLSRGTVRTIEPHEVEREPVLAAP